MTINQVDMVAASAGGIEAHFPHYHVRAATVDQAGDRCSGGQGQGPNGREVEVWTLRWSIAQHSVLVTCGSIGVLEWDAWFEA